jgi:hypothetical protein
LVLFFVLAPVCYAQTSDTSHLAPSIISADTTLVAGQSNDYAGDDFPFGIFLLFFAIGFFFLCLVCLGAGAVIAALGILVCMALVLAGAISTSVIAGMYKKSFGYGLKTFLTLCTVSAGAALGIGAALLFNTFFDYHFSKTFLFSVGSISGIVAGFVIGKLVVIMFRKILVYLKSRLPLA